MGKTEIVYRAIPRKTQKGEQKMTLGDLQKLLRKAWTRETSADPENWTPENPARNQCGVTALMV